MLSSALYAFADECFEKAWQDLGPQAAVLAGQIKEIPGDRGALLALAYGTLPISDTASVPVPVLDSYGQHALYLRENSPFCQNMDEDMFLHFVWYPRVNSEDLTECRRFFYEHLADRIEGLDAVSAILEVNRWCAEHMTYQLSDARTESPMTAFFSGTGRCGEESVFLVTALRSVGIASRQVYAPWWAHCDDNHAWVEAWDGANWRFLGACEPEPVLDRGWFCDASARAPLVHYRTFFDWKEGDPLVETMGSVRLYNVTARYAETTSLLVQVLDPDEKPAAGAVVELDVVNMAAYRPIVRSKTEDNGCLTIAVGRADLHVEVFWHDLCAASHIRPEGESSSITLHLSARRTAVYDCDMVPPESSPRNRIALSADEEREKKDVLAHCTAIREKIAQERLRPEYAHAEEPWPRFFALAAGNAPQLYAFYCAHPGRERALAAEMLETMAAKDFRDVTDSLCESHLQAALPYHGEEHFVEEILNPRIGFEVLEPWRPAVLANFSDQDRQKYASCPESLMEQLKASPDPSVNQYPTLCMTPLAVLATGHADDSARQTFFVAALRAMGIPARRNPSNSMAEYWREGSYHPADSSELPVGRLCLLPQEGERFVYGTNWTLSRLGKNRWDILTLPEGSPAPVETAVRAGLWRLMTARRLPDGSQLCRVYEFVVRPGQTVTVPLTIRKEPSNLLCCIPLDPMELRSAAGNLVSSTSAWSGPSVVIWLQIGAEPTEHILRELLAAASAVLERREQGLRLVLVFQNQEEVMNPLVQSLLAAIGDTIVLFDDLGRVMTSLAERLSIEPNTLPLLLLLDRDHACRFCSAGYQVGVVELVMKLLERLNGGVK